ncbi:MAG: carbohydrate kinase family protein [Candidatus Hydrothermarchaeaceae archaeon]
MVIGHASIDNVLIGGGRRTQLGGAAIYSAMAAKIFAETGVVSRIGADFPSKYFSLLRSSTIDVSGLKKLRGKSTFFSIEYDDDGVAHYSDYRLNVGIHIRPQDIPKMYLSAKAFHLAPMAASKQRSLLDYLRDRTYALVSLNTHSSYLPKYRRDISDLISQVDIFTINDVEAMRLTGTKGFEQALNVLKKRDHNLIIVTMGIYGSAIIHHGEITFAPSVIQPKIVDLTGCGDAFAGSFLASFVKNEDALEAANVANSVASITATDRSFKAIRGLRFAGLDQFHEFIISHQRKLGKRQRSIEHFF